MKKNLIPIFLTGIAAIVVLFFQKKEAQLKLEKIEDNTALKQELIQSFKMYRESIYRLKQIELMASLKKNESNKTLPFDTCVKFSDGVQAFIMRARLTPKSIEISDCKRMGLIYQQVYELKPRLKLTKPSYYKRLEKDLFYFSDELNKQAWTKVELLQKKKEFDQKSAANLFKMKKNPKAKKMAKSSPIKCMKTILLHQNEYIAICKKKL
jgi:hypothetical protein